MTHVCDYCGAKYTLDSEDDMVLCATCGEMRLYNLIEKRVSKNYSFVSKYVEPAPVEEEEEIPVKKREKKKSRDIKAKKAPSYAEKVMQRYNYRNGF